MNRITRTCTVLCLALCAAPAAVLAAPTDEKIADNTTYQVIAEIGSGQDALRRLELPYELLAFMDTHEQYRLEVRDQTGTRMPSHRFTLSTDPAASKQSHALSYFPFSAAVGAEAIRYSVQIGQDSGDTQINISDPRVDQNTNTTHYIIRVPDQQFESDWGLSRLTLEWPAPTDNFILNARLESSQDLQNWVTSVETAVLSDLQHNGQRLIHNTIELTPSSDRFFRLSWPHSNKNLQLTRVAGEFSAARRTEIWRDADFPCEQADPHLCQLHLPYAVRQVSLVPPEPSSDYYYQGKLYSAASLTDKWIHRESFHQYRLHVQDKTVSTSPLSIRPTYGPLWQLRFEPGEFNPDIRVRVRWQPAYQVFLAQGEGPYQLSVVESESSPSAHATFIRQVMRRAEQSLSDIEAVSLSKLSLNLPPPAYWNAQRIQTAILWAVLWFGVVVLGWIAVRLYRSMAAGDTDS